MKDAGARRRAIKLRKVKPNRCRTGLNEVKRYAIKFQAAIKILRESPMRGMIRNHFKRQILNKNSAQETSCTDDKFAWLFRIFFSDARKFKHKFAFRRSIGVAVELEALAKL